jgi:hypothetical protein
MTATFVWPRVLDAIHEAFAEMRRVGALSPTYQRLDELVRRANGR